MSTYPPPQPMGYAAHGHRDESLPVFPTSQQALNEAGLSNTLSDLDPNMTLDPSAYGESYLPNLQPGMMSSFDGQMNTMAFSPFDGNAMNDPGLFHQPPLQQTPTSPMTAGVSPPPLGHLIPDRYVPDAPSPEPSRMSTSFGSPMVMTGGQPTFVPFNLMGPQAMTTYQGIPLNVMPHSAAPGLAGSVPYASDRPMNLSLQVPDFNDQYFQQADQYGTPGTATPGHLRSPIITLEHVDDVPPQSGLNRTLSKNSRASGRSTGHLSPYADDSDDAQAGSNESYSITGAVRNSDGSWVPTDAGLAGLGPLERLNLNGQAIISINESAELRELQHRNAGVEEWLNSAGADEDEAERRNLRSRLTTRHRARSTGGQPQPEVFGHLRVPGPGATLNEPSEADFDMEDEESVWTEYDGGASPVPFPGISHSEFIASVEAANAEEVPGDARQPYQSSMAAIQVYTTLENDSDNFSLTATLGSRRKSESDMGSIKNVLLRKSNSARIRNFLGGRGKHRKNKSNASNGETPPTGQDVRRSSVGRRRSVNRSKSPRPDTNVAPGAESRSPFPFSNLVRSRSKSDVHSPGLVQMLRQEQGGPPMVGLASPVVGPSREGKRKEVDDGSGDEDPISMNLSVVLDMNIIPDRNGFKHQILTLNPHIDLRILDRLTEEQLRRFQRLTEDRRKHFRLASLGKCKSGDYCSLTLGKTERLGPSGKAPDTPGVIYQILAPGATEADQSLAAKDQTVQPASFPSGIPNPPVAVLPARFECPYCFRVKEIRKPSDWTKHVHEDVQPFTCTFPDCAEPKSFKRKADWVRHESERHRQLDSWTCDVDECGHVCYRRDNFVQHLVREHKCPEPRIRTGRAPGGNGGSGAHSRCPSPAPPRSPGPAMAADPSWDAADSVEDNVARVVERAHRSAAGVDARREPCRFCGNLCTSWKRLGTHLAKHMEQLSLPVVPLVAKTGAQRGMSAVLGGGQPPLGERGGPMAGFGMPQQQQGGEVFVEEPMDMDGQPDNALLTADPSLGDGLLDPAALGFALDGSGSAALSYPPMPGLFNGLGVGLQHGQQRGRASSTGAAFATPAMSRQGTTYPPPGFGGWGTGGGG
jgi:hypothetical protein